jgi:uncharacterized protein
MNTFIAALGLVCVIEGVLWALAPGLAARMLEAVAKVPEHQVRLGATAVVALGVFLVWLGQA